MSMKTARVALVTGGMGGLGEAICIKLAALGYKVVTTHSPGNTKAKEWLDGEGGLLTAQLGLYELISPNSLIDESSLTNIRTAQFSQSRPFAASPRFRSSDRPNEYGLYTNALSCFRG